MYYEERQDEAGNWFWRSTPDGAWWPFGAEKLRLKAEELRKAESSDDR